MHELKKFDDLICRCYSRGDSRAAFTSYNDSDVVVCDYGLLREFVDNNDRCPSIANFAAMFLDLRHCGWTSIRDKQQSSSTTKPSSLDSVQWWVCLNNFIAKCPTSMKRLVIEQPDHRQNCFVAPISGYDSLGGNEGSDKRSRKLLAMRVAFIFHPSTFVSERGSVGKRVISWAKFQAESSSTANETTTGDLALLLCKGSGALPSRGWSSVVSSVFDAMPADVEKKLPTNFSWKLHMCSLGKSQQLAYNKCFANMRRNSDNAIADGLLELRKACMHSTLQESTASLVAPLRRHNPKDRFVGKHGSSILSCSATSSESNIELARTIMKKSSKMKELLRVLVTEGGFKVARGMALFGSSSDCGEDPISVKKAPVEKAKVLILATLVEAQLLASSFLSAVGLHHEVLVSSVANQYSTPPSTMSSVESEHSWAWCQECLSRFNNASLERPIDILIASPMTASSLSCGIGLANADFVISIDEDWSGREASHIMSIFSKIYWSRLRAPVDAASSAANDSCKFIKLVCRNTCECAFLYNDSAQDCHAGIVQSNKKGPRRSSRQSTRTSKSNQHEPVGGIEHDDTRKIQTGLCPIQVVPAAAFTNADGFVVPANGGSGKSHMSPLDQCFVATNILRYRNSKLSTVFAVSSVGSDVLFLPTKQCLDHSVMASESDLAFAWALFNAEDRAFFHSTIPTRNFGVRPIISSPTVAFLVDGTSVRRYVESFKRSTSFIPGKQSFQPIHLRSERLVLGESMASGRDSTCTFASSTDLGRKTDLFDDDNSELLVYGLPDDVSRKRKLSAADFDSSRGESAQNIFSFCYSVINSTPATLLNHGNEGYESLVYFPPFFPYLLQEIETNALSPLNICAELPSRTSSEFTFTIETNPHAFCGVQMKVGNEEMSFHRMLLIADLQDPITHQSDLSLNSLILVSQKKRQQHRNNSNAMFELAGPILSDSLRKCSDGEGKKSLNKKLKRQHHHINSSSARDKGHSYFHNERLLEQACFARGKFDASNLGRIRLNCRLNDLVSISFDQSFSNLCIPYQSEMRCHQSNFYGSLPNRRNIAPVLLGAIPLANEELAFRKNKYRSGIILPVGVKTLRKEMPCSSSMEESAEPWTSIEDSILNGCVSRYGMNWQLAAYAVSSGMSCSTEIVGRDETFRKAIRRSAAQCHHRWSSILSENSSTATRLTGMHNNGSGAITRETSLFVTKMDSMQRESIIFDGLLPSTRVEQMSDQKNSTILLGQPSQVQRSQFANESISHRLAHLQKLKEASSKRIVINTPLPSSAPTHPSHSEAIQAARASMLSAASVTAPPRHEMWPLELLDFRKQQNTEAKEAPNPAPASSQSPYRHQSSVPHHVPHTIHPAQPHMIYHEAGHFPPPPHQPYRQYQQPGHVHPGPDSNVIYQPQPKTQRRQH